MDPRISVFIRVCLWVWKVLDSPEAFKKLMLTFPLEEEYIDQWIAAWIKIERKLKEAEEDE